MHFYMAQGTTKKLSTIVSQKMLFAFRVACARISVFFHSFLFEKAYILLIEELVKTSRYFVR